MGSGARDAGDLARRRRLTEGGDETDRSDVRDFFVLSFFLRVCDVLWERGALAMMSKRLLSPLSLRESEQGARSF
jgi:hypothetical protein